MGAVRGGVVEVVGRRGCGGKDDGGGMASKDYNPQTSGVSAPYIYSPLIG